MINNLTFDNRAWRGIRAVSNRVPITESLATELNTDKTSVIFDIEYHYTKKSYGINFSIYDYVTESVGRSSGHCDPCWGKWLFFDSLQDIINFIRNMGYEIINPQEIKEKMD